MVDDASGEVEPSDKVCEAVDVLNLTCGRNEKGGKVTDNKPHTDKHIPHYFAHIAAFKVQSLFNKLPFFPPVFVLF